MLAAAALLPSCRQSLPSCRQSLLTQTRLCSPTMSSTVDPLSGASSAADDDTPFVARDWRLDRARLTRQQDLAVLRRKPRFLPYAGACAFAQTLGISTEEEWSYWLELGEGRTPYCPSDPESHYRRQGTWISWRAFLTGRL